MAKLSIVSLTVMIQFGIITLGYAKSPDYWPTDSWRTDSWRTDGWRTGGWRISTPEEQGMDSETLLKLIDYIKENELNIHSVTIIRHGYIVFDAYFWPMEPDDLHDVASCTKSVTSTLIGIAQDQSYLDINQPMLDFFPDRTVANLDDDKESITVRNLLTMTAGMECVNQPTEITLLQMQASPDWVQFALDLPMEHEPGTHYVYSSTGSHLLSAIVTQATAMSAEVFARKNLFDPLGIKDAYWPCDPQGYSHGWGDIQMTPHDMAKIGFLMLNKGRWEDEQIVSRKYVRQATRNHTGKFGPEEGYGYQWWAYKFGSFQAVGRGGQRIFVLPLLDLIVVVTAGATTEETAHYETVLSSFILPAIKSRKRALTPNPDGVAKLNAKIAEIARPPDPQPIPALPTIAHEISGKTWVLDSNPPGWQAISLTFNQGDGALAKITIDGEEYQFPIGLDGISRITSDSKFAASSRYEGQDVALKGWWEGNTFVLHFNTLAVIDNGTIWFRFEGDELVLTLYERTFMRVGQEFKGKLKE